MSDEIEVPKWLAWIVGIIAGSATSAWAGVRWLLPWLEQRREKHLKQKKDSIEWILDQHKKIATALEAQLKQKTSWEITTNERINRIQTDHLNCEMKLAQMTERCNQQASDIEELKERVQSLEKRL